MDEQNFKYDNHPRESVSWYQAVAYTRWLTARFQAAELLPAGWEIRLPTEQEWEASARYPDGRVFAWGNEYVSGYANINETSRHAGTHSLRQTTAVGIYPQGRNPATDVHDLSGNVWEWTLSEWDAPEQARLDGDRTRVLRGGSWYDNVLLARAASRYADYPNYWYWLFGFRVCCAPIQSADR